MGPMEDEQVPEAEGAGSYYDGLPRALYISPEQLRVLAEESTKADRWREAERMKDPVYRRLKQGYWEYPTASENNPKKVCMASFLSARGGVLLMDWAGDHKGAFLAFFGGGIPRASRIDRMRVSLIQSGQTQTVQAFHAPFLWARDLGMIMFAVPSTEAVLNSIDDIQDFEVKADGRTLVWGEWHSGNQARDRLRRCVSDRRQ